MDRITEGYNSRFRINPNFSYNGSGYQDFSWRVPATPAQSPRHYGEPSWVWSSPVQIRRPSPLVPMPPREFNDTVSSEDMSYFSLIVPRPPAPSPRPYGEPSWVWHSPIQMRQQSPLVPMPPRQFNTPDSGRVDWMISQEFNRNLNAMSDSHIPQQISTERRRQPLMLLRHEGTHEPHYRTPHRPQRFMRPRHLHYSSGAYTNTPSRKVKGLEPTSIDSMRMENVRENFFQHVTQSPFYQSAPVQITSSPAIARSVAPVQHTLRHTKKTIPPRDFNVMMPGDKEFFAQRFAKADMDYKEQIQKIIKLHKDIDKLRDKYLTTYNENKHLEKEIANQVIPEYDVKHEDPEILSLKMKSDIEKLQAKINLIKERDQMAKIKYQKHLKLLDKINRDYNFKIGDFKDRLKVAKDQSLFCNLMLHELQNKNKNLKFKIAIEEAQANKYEKEFKREKRERKANKELVQSLKNKVDMLLFARGLPFLTSPLIGTMSEEATEMMSEIVDEIKKKTSSGATNVEPRHIMHILKRYLRADSYRKALTWQKKFLLLALRNYEKSSGYNVFSFKKRYFNAKGLWRVGAATIIAIIRTRKLVQNRSVNHHRAVYTLQNMYAKMVK